MQRSKAFILFIFSLLPSFGQAANMGDASKVPVEECFKEKDYSLNLFLKGAPVGVTKEGCRARVVFFQGAGSRWIVDLCNPEIRLDYQAPMDGAVETLYSGSGRCPAPLFGIDIGHKESNAEHFNKAESEVRTLLKEIRETNGKKDLGLDSVGGQLHCLERELDRYLHECVPFHKETKAAKEP